MTSWDDTLQTVCITQELDQFMPVEKVRSWMKLGFPKTSMHLRTTPTELTSMDLLGASGALYEMKSWAVASAGRRILVTMLVSDESGSPGVNAGMSRGRNMFRIERSMDNPVSDADRVAHDLRRARALRELSEIESKRAVWRAYGLGLSQRQIGDLLGRSQPDVGRTIKKVDSDISCAEITPREIALRRLVGEYTNAEMMARLLTITYTHGEADPLPIGGGYVPGTWDEVRRLRDEDLISEREWEELFRAVMGEPTDSSDLLVPSEDE